MGAIYKSVQINRKQACQPLLRAAALEISPRLRMRLDSRWSLQLSILLLLLDGWIGWESLQQYLRTCSIYNKILQRYSGLEREPRESAIKCHWEYLASQIGRDLWCKEPLSTPTPCEGVSHTTCSNCTRQAFMRTNMHVFCVWLQPFPLLIAFWSGLRMSLFLWAHPS